MTTLENIIIISYTILSSLTILYYFFRYIKARRELLILKYDIVMTWGACIEKYQNGDEKKTLPTSMTLMAVLVSNIIREK